MAEIRRYTSITECLTPLSEAMVFPDTHLFSSENRDYFDKKPPVAPLNEL